MKQMNEFIIKRQDVQFCMETATSVIYFTRDYIYKIKKSVCLQPFIDYRERDNRTEKMKLEFQTGVTYSPEVYVSIGFLYLGQIKGEPCICMRRIPLAETVFDYLSTKENVEFSLVALLDFVKKFHICSSEKNKIENQRIQSLRERTDMLLQEAGQIGKGLDLKFITEMKKAAETYDAVFAERYRAGYVIKLHGDLHTGNILYDKKRFYLFDFLDFQEPYTSGDYLYDIGFLLADMCYFGFLIEENSIERLAERLEEPLSLLCLFVSYGALNRANVFYEEKKEVANKFYKISNLMLRKGSRRYDE